VAGAESPTCLGLSIVQRPAQTLSGTAECRSVLGQGVAFTVFLPVKPGPA
jgi:signal transduction histidine kinase